MVKILHTGDLHLDSPMSSLELATAEAARDEHRHVFSKMMQYATDEKIDMILISGDLFDGRFITSRTKELVINAFRDFARPVIIAPGNHDPYSAISLYRGGSLPENVHVFSSEEIQVFDFDDLSLSVYGYAFTSPALSHSPLGVYLPKPRAEGENHRVLCAHADLTSPISNYAPLSVSQIEQYGFDYAALGHVHNPPKISSDKTLINYCGFLFGRSFDEIGMGGAYLVTIDEGGTNAERISFSEHVFIKDELDVSGVLSTDDIKAKISELASERGYGKSTSLRLSLIGTVPFDLTIDKKALEASPCDLYELEIKDLTTRMPDAEQLKGDPSLRGEIYRMLLPRLESDDLAEKKCAAEALWLALCAIDGINVSAVIESEGDEI